MALFLLLSSLALLVIVNKDCFVVGEENSRGLVDFLVHSGLSPFWQVLCSCSYIACCEIFHSHLKHTFIPFGVIRLLFTAISRCDMFEVGCQQVCFMDHGQPKCSCQKGYKLNSDGRTCDGELKSTLDFSLLANSDPIIYTFGSNLFSFS